MPLPPISSTLYRGEVRRVSLNDRSKFVPRSNSPNKKGHNRVSPELGDISKSDEEVKEKWLFRRGCFLLTAAIVLLLILVVVVAIVLALKLPSSTTASAALAAVTSQPIDIDSSTNAPVTTSAISSIALTTTVCTSTSRGTLLTLTGLNPSTWTLYSHTYVASRTTPTLTFAFQVDGTREYHLDGVSLISVTPPFTQLLTNPSFENSTSLPAGWTVGCESTCGAAAAHVLSGANCYLSSGLCLSAHCSSGRSAFILLSQSFNAIIGNTYTISYQLIQTGSASAGLLQFYLDVL